MIGIVGDMMEMTLGDVCKVVIERAVAEKILDFCEKEKIPTEMMMGAIIFLMWNKEHREIKVFCPDGN